jgi:hypothetical protein
VVDEDPALIGLVVVIEMGADKDIGVPVPVHIPGGRGGDALG